MKKFNYTIEEMVNDARNIETSNKKETAAKYGIQSNKINDIAQQIYGIALEQVRQKRADFTDDDARAFDLFFNFPEAAQKVRASLDTMPVEFVQWIIAKMVASSKQSSRNARIYEKRIKAYTKYLNERLESTDDVLAQIFDRLIAQTTEFHQIYMEHTLDASKQVFESMIQFKDIKSIKAAFEFFNVPKEPQYNWNNPSDEWQAWKRIAKRAEKQYAAISTFRHYSNDFNLEDYMKKETERIENDFNQNMKLIAKRVQNKQMNVEQTNVRKVYDNDAKAFEMYLSDDNQTVHARSIFCAQYSSIVTPHWRFIITNA